MGQEEKKGDLVPEAATPKPPPSADPPEPPLYRKTVPTKPVQPCYKKIQKWIKKNPTAKKESIQDPQEEPQRICMFSPADSSYNKDFPSLEEFTEKEFRHIPKIPTQLHGEKISAAEATLNWQTENALAQNATLRRIDARVAQMDTKITMVETKVDGNTKIANELIVSLHRMLKEAERRPSEPGRDPFYQMEQKNQEIQRLKDHIKYLQEHDLSPSAPPSVRSEETLFSNRTLYPSLFSSVERSPPSLPSMFQQHLIEPKRLAPYELRNLIRQQEVDQKREREERERKGKSHVEEEPEQKISRSLMIRDEQQLNPLSSFLKGYKEAIIPRIAALNT
ncbi:hypothetical protein GQ457_01G014850 [Hibiscus cannabinus]